jgi:alkylation response protein AidB-like acyl-CoA dehydrogenase
VAVTTAATPPATPFSAEDEALGEAVARFADERLAPHAEAWESAGTPSASAVSEAAALGYLGASYPTEAGGGGGGPAAAVAVAEALGARLPWGPTEALLSAAHRGPACVAAAGDAQATQRWLVPALTGESVLALAAPRGDQRSPVSAIPAAQGWSLTGTATGVSLGRVADGFVVAALHDHRVGLFVVNAEAAGVHTEAAPMVLGGQGAGTAEVSLTDVAVSGEAVLAAPGGAEPAIGAETAIGAEAAIELQRTQAWLAEAAALAAHGQATFDATLIYAGQRHAFGRPIGRFQANRHRLAELATQLTAARQLVLVATGRARDDGMRACGPEIARARRYAARAAAAVAEVGLQLHGGYGYSMESPMQRAWRDTRALDGGDGVDAALSRRITVASPAAA